jgi:enoyl-CoA hydratase/carnithine racemase
MDNRRITLDVTDGLGVLTFERPDKLNALDRRALEELASAVENLDDVRVLVVRGAGSSFCAGVDIGEVAGAAGDDSRIAEMVSLGRRAADALARCPAITIAAIHGHCVGGGVVMAASCDLRIAAADARFRIPELELGIPLVWGGIPTLLRTMPAAVAKDLVMTCRPFDAEEGLRVGFLSRVVPESHLQQELDAVAGDLLALPAPALAITKGQFLAIERDGAERDELTAVLEALAGGVGSG